MGDSRRRRGSRHERGRRHRQGEDHERPRRPAGPGAARRSGALPPRRGQDDAMDLHPGAAQGAHAGGDPDRDAGEPHARHRARSGRRLRQQAQHLPRRGARGFRLARTRPADQVGGKPFRELHGHHPRSRPGGRRGDGPQERRRHHRVPLQRAGRLRSLLSVAHRGHLYADGFDAPRPL